MSQSSTVTKVYSALESTEVAIGGGGGFEGFYGSVTAGGVSKVYAAMAEHCSFGQHSFLVDIGGGLGRPLMHALVEPGVKYAIGIEVDEIKCMKSESVIHDACQKMQSMGLPVHTVPLVLHRNIEMVNAHGTLDPATHAYTFWEGVPAKARQAFAQLFVKSSTLQCVAIVQRAIRKETPAAFMRKYGFGDLTLVDTVKSVHMSGSHRCFTGYIFKRASPPGKPFQGDHGLMLSAYLIAPRMMQVTLPRILRSRSTQAPSSSHRPASSQLNSSSVLSTAGNSVRRSSSAAPVPERAVAAAVEHSTPSSRPREACAPPPAGSTTPATDLPDDQTSRSTRSVAGKLQAPGVDVEPVVPQKQRSQVQLKAFGLASTVALLENKAKPTGLRCSSGLCASQGNQSGERQMPSPNKRAQDAPRQALAENLSPSKKRSVTRRAGTAALKQAQ